jgi:hypothetical protein
MERERTRKELEAEKEQRRKQAEEEKAYRIQTRDDHVQRV